MEDNAADECIAVCIFGVPPHQALLVPELHPQSARGGDNRRTNVLKALTGVLPEDNKPLLPDTWALTRSTLAIAESQLGWTRPFPVFSIARAMSTVQPFYLEREGRRFDPSVTLYSES